MRFPLSVEIVVSHIAVRSINHVIGAITECVPLVHCGLDHHKSPLIC
jgi:hypothetical protein